MVGGKIIPILFGLYILGSILFFFAVLITQGRHCGENQPATKLLPDLRKFTRKIRKRFLDKYIDRDRNRFAP